MELQREVFFGHFLPMDNIIMLVSIVMPMTHNCIWGTKQPECAQCIDN
uniref:Uncharacterized protein n=1 Tax=Anguilla anguilla TaxID=7936 RepID=A0A0E9T277_ANGAN